MADNHTDKEQKDSDVSVHSQGVVNFITRTNNCAENGANEILHNEASATRTYESQKELSPVNGEEMPRKIVGYQRAPEEKTPLGRPLGGLEVVYHHAMSKGMDMICLMTKLSTTFSITPDLTKQALYLLAEQHPLLRMTIQCAPAKASNQISFLEMEEIRIDFAIERDDWLSDLMEEVAEPFDIAKGPLWKCRLLLSRDKSVDRSKSLKKNEISTRTSKTLENERNEWTDNNLNYTGDQHNDFVHEATFLFVWHHSIMDGGYVVRIFKEFAEILDRIHSGPMVDSLLERSLPPPLEHVLRCPSEFTRNQLHCNPEPGTQSLSSVRPDSSHSWLETLEDYNRRFSHEIARSVHTSPNNECMVYEFNVKETKHIMQMCKSEGVTANGLFSTASILAFIDLLYPVTQRNHFGIPFEFMLDFRRHLPLKISNGSRRYFQGVASIHIPMMADIQLSTRPVTKCEFWAMSRSFGSAIQNEVHSQETFQWMRDLVKETTSSKQQQPVGKSPYVLCLSNMGRLDGVLNGDITKRMRLTGLHGHPTVLIENSPIFFVSIFLLNGKLCGNVSFCANYTSRKTAAGYIGHFKKHILSQSKL